MSWDQDAYARSIIADLARVRPLGDFVLVQPFTLDEQLAMESRQIAPSPIQMTRDGRYVSNRGKGLRYGRVVAMGDGDRVIGILCSVCGLEQHRIERGQDQKKWRCAGCGSFDLHAGVSKTAPWVGSAMAAETQRAPLGCRIGDTVIFPRVPANEISINGQEFVCIHEEQHVWGVIETGEYITLPARDLRTTVKDGEPYIPEPIEAFDPARPIAAKSIEEPVYV